MLPCNPGRTFEVAAKADLRRIRIALKQERLFAGASNDEAAGDENENCSPRCHPPAPTPFPANWRNPALAAKSRPRSM